MTAFCSYVTYDTWKSDEHSTPSLHCQAEDAGRSLRGELAQMGSRTTPDNEYGYAYAWLPATAGCEGIPVRGPYRPLLDTSPDALG